MYGEHAAFLCKVVEIIEAAADISKHCGNRGSCRPHIKDKDKERVHKDENQDCREDAEEQRDPAAEGRRGFRLFFSVLSQQDGDERASSNAQHICDRHVHDKYRIRKGDGGNLIGVMSLSHKKGIRHIVNYENKG